VIRYLIFAVLAYLLYRLLRRYLFGPQDTYVDSGRWKQRSEVEEEVIKDPQCGVYCPKKEMIPLKSEGMVLHFCSEKCKNLYLQTHGKKETRSET
jgi:YHS domain-containing protein